MRVRRLIILLAPVLAMSTLVSGPARAVVSPAVTITSPVDGSFADGTIVVTAAGTDDGAGGDLPQYMTLYVDRVANQTIDCTSGGASSCPISFGLDADTLTRGSHQLMVEFWTTDAAVLSPAVMIGAQSPAPGVGASLVGAGSVYDVQGGAPVSLFTVAAGWTRQAGTPMSLQMLVDGGAVGGPVSCPTAVVGESPCTSGLTWHLPGGSHTVQSRLLVGTTVVDSTPITVTVLVPSVVITSPAAGTVVDKTVTVTVLGTAAGPDDSPQSLAISTNRVSVNEQTQACPVPSAATCAATFTVPVTALTSLIASFTTSHLTVNSPSVPVTSYSTSSIGLSFAVAPPGKTSQIEGGVSGTTSGVRASAVQLTLTPVIGKARTVTVPVASSGLFAYDFQPAVNTVVRADLPATSAYSAASASTIAIVPARPTCHLASTVARSTLTRLNCSLAQLPKGTKVTLQFSAHHRWYTAVAGFSAAGKVTLRLHWSRAQLLWLRVAVAGSKVFGPGVGKPFSIRVT